MSIESYIDSLSEEDREALARKLYRRGYGVKDVKRREAALTGAVSALVKLLKASSFSRSFVQWCRTEDGGNYFIEYAERLNLVHMSVKTGGWVLSALGKALAERMGCLHMYEYRMEAEEKYLQR